MRALKRRALVGSIVPFYSSKKYSYSFINKAFYAGYNDYVYIHAQLNLSSARCSFRDVFASISY